VIVVDASVIFSLLHRGEGGHEAVTAWYRRSTPALATTPLILGEVDLLAARWAGRHALTAFRDDVAAGAYAIEWWPGAAEEAIGIAERYGDLGVSLADASLVALAGRLGTTAIATLDERHFRAMRPLGAGAAFQLLPADEPR
jgi:predicted nucleic acid-binding protein